MENFGKGKLIANGNGGITPGDHKVANGVGENGGNSLANGKANGGIYMGNETETFEASSKEIGNGHANSNGNGVPIPEGLSKNNGVNEVAFWKDFNPPEFTFKELRDVVPPELFERCLAKSSAYLGINLLVVFVLFYLSTLIDSHLPKCLQFFAWPLYWWFEGIAATGIWVIAHECGHQAFCNSRMLNNCLGLVLHSALLVPYHSWRISHAQHHAGTSHMDKDQVFVPKRRSRLEKSGPLLEAVQETPFATFVVLMTYLTIGWPAYLIANKSGQPYDKFTCHFLPSSPIFRKGHRDQVLLSNFALLLVFGLLSYWIYEADLWTVTKYYFIPYFFVNGWLVCITLLQHTDIYIPHYSPKAWDFVRGALCTVDRDYGWFLNHALHHIQDSHVAHHLFSQMPHYNAIKATPYLKEKLGKYYLYDNTPVWKALMRAIGQCVFVEDTGDVLFYKARIN